MRTNKPIYVLIVIFVVLLLAGWLLYQIPEVQARLAWRLDRTVTYLRGVVDPVEPLPTQLPRPSQTAEPTQTPTPRPTLTPLPPTDVPTPTPTFTPTPLPGSAILSPPPYVKQTANNCGPATLTMYLKYYGWKGEQIDATNQLKPLVADRNVNVEELVYFARTNAGWLNAEFRVGGDIDLLRRLLANGFPMMIEESFVFTENGWPNDDHWGAHYFLITGYDDATQSFTGQDSFYGPDRTVPYQELDQKWRTFNRVYILLFQLSDQNRIQTLLGPDWDPAANRQHALDVAQAEADLNPADAFAWFNIGSNLVYFERYAEASDAYRKALEIGLPQRMLRYQFGPFFAYFHTLQTDDLLALTEAALKRTPNSEEALLWKGWALYRKGRSLDAINSFQEALLNHPGYADAEYGLKFVAANP